MSRFKRGAPNHHPYRSCMDEAVHVKLLQLHSKGELKYCPLSDYEILIHIVRFVDETATRTDVFPTRPDEAFLSPDVLSYHDGPVHQKVRVEKRDAEINDYLVERGWTVLRFIYDGKYSKKKRNAIVSKTAEVVNGDHRISRVEEIEL